MDIKIFTNGTLLTSEWISFFKRYPIKKLIITIYGSSEEDYIKNSFEHQPGLFNRIQNAVEELSRTNMPHLVQCHIYKNNPDLREKLCTKLNTKTAIRKIAWVFPRSLNDMSNMHVLFPIRDCRWERSGSDKKKLSKETMGCGVGYSNLHITSDWKVKPCIFYPHPGFDLNEFSLEEIFYKKISDTFSQSISIESKCYVCYLSHICTRCAAMGYGTIGDNSARDILCGYTAQNAVLNSEEHQALNV